MPVATATPDATVVTAPPVAAPSTKATDDAAPTPTPTPIASPERYSRLYPGPVTRADRFVNRPTRGVNGTLSTTGDPGAG